MRVWRVQNAEGVGPYNGTICTEQHHAMFIQHDNNKGLWPLPHHEELPDPQDHIEYICGFINEAQLHNWFTTADLEHLASVDFHVVIVDACVLAIGANQVVCYIEEPTQ